MEKYLVNKFKLHKKYKRKRLKRLKFLLNSN